MEGVWKVGDFRSISRFSEPPLAIAKAALRFSMLSIFLSVRLSVAKMPTQKRGFLKN